MCASIKEALPTSGMVDHDEFMYVSNVLVLAIFM